MIKKLFTKVFLAGLSLFVIFPVIVSAESKKTITAFGDSLTAGYGLPISEGYPSLLEKKLHKEGYLNYQVINSGLSGETTAAAKRRVNWVLKTKPELVILTLGGNDALRALPASETKKNLSEIIKELTKNKVKVLLSGMKAPQNLGTKYCREFDAVYPALAKEHKLPLIPFFLEGVALKPTLNISDGVHPNVKGYQIIVDKNVFPFLKPLLVKP